MFRIIRNIKIINRFRFYHKKVIDHYESPRNVGSLDKNDPNVGTGLVGLELKKTGYNGILDGCDISPDMLKIADEKYLKEAPIAPPAAT